MGFLPLQVCPKFWFLIETLFSPQLINSNSLYRFHISRQLITSLFKGFHNSVMRLFNLAKPFLSWFSIRGLEFKLQSSKIGEYCGRLACGCLRQLEEAYAKHNMRPTSHTTTQYLNSPILYLSSQKIRLDRLWICNDGVPKPKVLIFTIGSH